MAQTTLPETDAREPFAKALSRINPALPDGTEVSLSIDGVEVYRLALSSLRSLVSA